VTYAFAVPIPPGKTDDVRRFMAEPQGTRKAEYEDLARRSEVSEKHSWLQHDAAGDVPIAASDSDQTTSMQILANPETEFDRGMREQIGQIFGFDTGAPAGPTNESLGIVRL
jgi:hypothetical protein